MQCMVFAAAGSSSMVFVRPLLAKIGFSSTSLLIMTWPEKFASLLIMSPIYSILLLCYATLAGRYPFFRPFILRMWQRTGLGSTIDKILP